MLASTIFTRMRKGHVDTLLQASSCKIQTVSTFLSVGEKAAKREASLKLLVNHGAFSKTCGNMEDR